MSKKNVNSFRKISRSLLVFLYVSIQTCIFAFVWLKSYNQGIVLPFVQKGHLLIFLFFAFLLFVFLVSFDGVKFGIYGNTNLITGQFLAILATDFFTYWQISLLSARLVNVFPLLYMLLAGMFVDVLYTVLANKIWGKFFRPQKTLLIYDDYSPEEFLKKISTRKDKYVIKKTMCIDEGIEEIKKEINGYSNVILYNVHANYRNILIKYCFENDIRLYSTEKVSDVLLKSAETLHLFDTPLLLFRNSGLSPVQKFLKRTMDIVVSLLVLILTSPLFLISALAIKLYDGGPVFFRQERGTVGGNTFRIHKFRSMIVDAEKDGLSHPAQDEDPRITPVGKVLRSTRLDELPQLIDILVGDMSLVGPRPERVEHIKQYSELVPEFPFRQKVKGGLTGYAQIYGKYNTTAYDKLQLDLMYIQNYSFMLDIKLLLMTVKIIFMKESTEGFTEEKSSEITQKSQDNE